MTLFGFANVCFDLLLIRLKWVTSNILLLGYSGYTCSKAGRGVPRMGNLALEQHVGHFQLEEKG